MMNWNDVIHFANNGTPEPDKKIAKSEDEWKKILTPEQFRITRKKGTERAFTGEYCHAQ